MGADGVRVEVNSDELIVTSGRFCAVYYKAPDKPQLILRNRTHTDDFELLAKVWKAVCDKARELGWMV